MKIESPRFALVKASDGKQSGFGFYHQGHMRPFTLRRSLFEADCVHTNIKYGFKQLVHEQTRNRLPQLPEVHCDYQAQAQGKNDPCLR